MMQIEFEKLAGYEVSTEDYNNIIEPMYYASNLDKADFVKCLDSKRFALKTRKQMQDEMKKDGKHIKASCTHCYDGETRDHLDMLADEYVARFYGAGFGWLRYTKDMVGDSYVAEIEIYSRKSYKVYETIQVA